MIYPICKDERFLAQKAEPATQDDRQIGCNLMETLKYHKDKCVGMAANMIHENKRIIAVNDNGKFLLMYNPQILKKSDPYMTSEGCLSLDGQRETKRWKSIKVQYQNEDFQTRIKTFKGWTAQIIQHEIDHCDGILI